MMSKNLFRWICTIALIFVLATVSKLQAQSVQEQLEAAYPYARGTDGCHVGNPDSALVAQSPVGGMRILPVSSSVTIAKCTNHYQDGKLKPPSSACNGEGVAKAGGFLSHIPKVGGAIGAGSSKVGEHAANQQMDVVTTGDTVYPIKLEANESKGEVKFTIITCKQGGDQQNPYKGEIVFHFKSLKPENVSQVEDTIATVFKQGGGDKDNGGDQGNGNGNGGGGQQQGGGGQAQQGSGQDQQQDDPASACNPEVGQTVDQVEAACGKPTSQAKGANLKLIYNYSQPKLKIIFMKGKVADIE